jgi:signal recognition particle subunit SRP54
MLDKLSNALRDSMRKFISNIFLDEKTLNQFVNEIQRALLQADVSVDLVFQISENIKKRAREEIGKGEVAKEYIIKIVYEELVKILGERGYKIEVTEKPFKILLIGLFGNGKTTTAAKIAKFFKKRGYKVCLLALDTFRPAAFEQLTQLGNQIGVPVFGDKKEKNPAKVVKEFENEMKKYDVVIADSSGRDALKQDMIDEITSIRDVLKPQEILLVQGADVGQGAKEQATAFKKALNITGVVLTKMDGTAKGGGAITACAIAGAPIKFIGVGERIDDLEEFEPKRFVSRLLGMGDLETLLEKAKEIAQEKAPDKEMEKRLMSGKFNLLDFKAQLEAMSKMGPLTKIIDMIPGMGMAGIPKEMLGVQQEKLKKFKIIMDSMTKEELENPDIIKSSRINRIAKGSGVEPSEVRELLKQFNQIKKLMKGLKGKDIQKLAKRFGKLPKNLMK